MTKGTSYELLVQEVYQALLACPDIEVRHNVRLTGRSGATHQIDVMWTFEQGGVTHTVLVECKDKGRSAKKEAIAAFKGVLDDIRGRPLGVFVSRSGFQSGAVKYAQEVDIRLLEIRQPGEEDWMKDELRAIHIDLRLLSRDFNVISLDVEVPPGRCSESELGEIRERCALLALEHRHGPRLFDGSDTELGRLTQLLSRHSHGLQPGERHTLTFEPGIYIEIPHERLTRARVNSCEYSFTVSEMKAPIVVDFREQVRLVVNDIIERTQIRLNKDMKPSGRIARDVGEDQPS